MFRRLGVLMGSQRSAARRDPVSAWMTENTPEALQPALRQFEQAPLLCILAITGTTLIVIDWYHNRKCHNIIHEAHQRVTQDVQDTLKEVHQTLSGMEATWAADLKHKEEFIRQLHQQNVEQTRSIDRLTAALRSCPGA